MKPLKNEIASQCNWNIVPIIIIFKIICWNKDANELRLPSSMSHLHDFVVQKMSKCVDSLFFLMYCDAYVQGSSDLAVLIWTGRMEDLPSTGEIQDVQDPGIVY